MAKKQKKKRTANVEKRVAQDVTAGPRDKICRAYLILAAFCAGASVMIVELTGNRILAPMFGNSLYTWTGLIGVILISISCGYYLGGYLADRRPHYVVLVHLLALSAALTMLVPLFRSIVEKSVGTLDVVWGPVLATTLLFALPGLLLASVSPFAIRLISLLWQDKNVGISAGCIGMLSTMGSVAGTFGTGFVLVPRLGIQAIFLATGGGLAVLAATGYLLFAPRFRQDKALVLLPLFIFVVIGTIAYLAQEEVAETVVYDRTTFYHRIQVIEQSVLSSVTGEEADRLRTLRLDTTDEGSQLVKLRQIPPGYQIYWELGPLFCPQLERTAFLGGGAFTMPEALLDAVPRAHADVVEIDPVVIDVGRKYFRVEADEYKGRMNAVAGDARRFLRLTDSTYDLIFADAYHGKKSIPSHLVTVEFFGLAKSRLNDQGVLIVNVTSAISGEDAIVFQSVAKTVGKVFDHQCMFATEPGKPEESQNVFIVAASHDLKIESLLSKQYDEGDSVGRLMDGYLAPGRYDLSGGLIFTDDHNPVEYLVARTL